MRNGVVDFEARRLMKAFEKISDPQARRIIMKIVEEAAAKRAAPKAGEPGAG